MVTTGSPKGKIEGERGACKNEKLVAKALLCYENTTASY